MKKVCPFCGAEFTPHDYRQKCCSRSCSQRARRNSKLSALFTCPYNHEVDCTLQMCGKCGWNPEVAKARLEKYLEVGHEG